MHAPTAVGKILQIHPLVIFKTHPLVMARAWGLPSGTHSIQMKNGERGDLFLGFLTALAALYLSLVTWSLSECQFWILTLRVTFETWDPSDIRSEWFLDKKTNHKDKKESLIMWLQGSFALLRCLNAQSVVAWDRVVWCQDGGGDLFGIFCDGGFDEIWTKQIGPQSKSQ